MKRSVLQALLSALLICLSLTAAWAGSDARHAALAWLAQIDAGKYDESWSHASILLRQRVTPDRWQARLTRAHDALGNISMRMDAGMTFSKTLPGFPDGEYVTVRFNSSFFKQRNGTEAVSLRFEDGRWRPVSYSPR